MGKYVFVCALVVVGFLSWVQAQPTTNLFIDESGNGTLDGQPIPWSIGQDTGPGGLSNALIYLPGLANWTVGDLLLQEPAGSGGGSDLIRFNTDGSLVFYSDTDDGVSALADIGLPTLRYANNKTEPELDYGPTNGILYVPNDGSDPGFRTGLQMQYHITSDVPEPATLSFLALGGLAMLRRRK